MTHPCVMPETTSPPTETPSSPLGEPDGNLEKQDKAKIVKAIVAAEKADEKAKMPAVNLRAMYGN